VSSAPFSARHLGPSAADVATMLSDLGLDSVEQLLDQAVPASIRQIAPLNVPAAMAEHEVLAELRDIASENAPMRSYLGLGYHGTITPPVLRRNLLENPAWYSAYTPYQPEISQGRLEALLTFQTMVADLTGMQMANASLLDEGTAVSEAITMCRRSSRVKGRTVLIDAELHPQSRAVTDVRMTGVEIDAATWEHDASDPDAGLTDQTFAIVLQTPASSGVLRDLAPVAAAAKARGILVVVVTDLLACTLITPPGEWGADVVVGTSQRLGVPMMAGGPHAAFLATSDTHKRSLPGRLVGVSIDAQGRTAFRLALQTREQHIRREKATSNICTSQVLLANVAGMYAVHHGPEGLTQIATRINGHTAALVAALSDASGVTVVNDGAFFDTVTVRVEAGADSVIETALQHGINLRMLDAHHVTVAFDETVTAADVHDVAQCFVEGSSQGVEGASQGVEGASLASGIPDALRRTSEFLTDGRFHAYRSETELMRWLRELADKDIALDRAMIPLGSCTMKLNAAVEMEPVTWPAFADVHPFAPVDQYAGTLRIIRDLERDLAEITGYDAVSLQPNSGAQGELAGLLAIRAFHDANDGAGRTVCLIPSSAHGTNAASAVMAGMSVVVIACDDEGNIDVDDLKHKCVAHADDLAALMITYPSTHGVYEESVGTICELVHEYGGQVYLDGANLNALVGIAQPGQFGADVSHLNLHKTFCIPHGGGGPGVGPIGVRSHLAPYLPNHPMCSEAGPVTGPGPVASAPFGSPGVLAIPWAYLRLMGPAGLREATATAILSANWMAQQLDEHFPVLYRGANGRVAHECIIDVRPLEIDAGISNEDVAKRLIDHGFHAPTMSFPVAGTLMIEPTESEALVELRRFIDAMASIRDEANRVKSGEWPLDDNPLVNAPHTADSLLVEEWNHPYTREQAAYPSVGAKARKYWPPVSRVDNAYGDRNLMCECPPMDSYTS
jgi:glycine dehydrogenase